MDGSETMRYLTVTIMLLVFAACSGDDNKSTCVQGATQGCLRGDGSDGFQECLGAGSWGACLAFSEGDTFGPGDTLLPDDAVAAETGDEDVQGGDDAVVPVDVPVGDDAVSPDDVGGGGDLAAPEDGGCVPDCVDKECGDDGCGGYCNGCIDYVFDDGETETAFGYSTQPDPAPSRIACMVRFELPETGMKLTQFAAGWMYGLYNLKIPFELAWVAGEDVDCEHGTEGAWYTEWCHTTPDKFHSIGDFLPLEPYEAMDASMLGEVVFTSSTVFVTTFFEVDEYPIYVCPLDTSGDGTNSFMMPQYVSGQGESLAGPSFNKTEENTGVVPFRIRVEQAQ